MFCDFILGLHLIQPAVLYLAVYLHQSEYVLVSLCCKKNTRLKRVADSFVLFYELKDFTSLVVFHGMTGHNFLVEHLWGEVIRMCVVFTNYSNTPVFRNHEISPL